MRVARPLPFRLESEDDTHPGTGLNTHRHLRHSNAMPDWFYRTVSRPLLYRLRPRTARSFALGFMGRLARLPLGPWVIDLLGHMRADPRLAVSLLGREFPSPVGLGPGLDPQGVALP